MFAKRTFSAVSVALLLAACSPSTDSELVGQTRQAIVGGSASDETQDATVLLFVLDPSGPTRLGICTAALVAPRLVLTARHCVSSTDEAVACNADGTPLVGAKIFGNRDAANLYVFTGRERPDFIGDTAPSLDPTKWKPAGRGLEIIDDASSTLCDHDLALVLLEAPIDDVPVATLRLDGEVATGEKLLTVGWGVTYGEVEPEKRQKRAGVTTKRVGPNESIPVLTKSEFLFDESICLGDSGGPVFAEATNAIVGVVSRGGNGLDPNKGGPSSTCEGADNVATKLAPFKPLVMKAFERAGAQPKLEAKPEESCSVGAVGGAARGGRGALLVGLGVLGSTFARRRRPI
ncbi:MAG TPA: S1 family peptidase [Labilithrix sp.]|nr:S1 family peptidase [Labilithrix sp.]